MNLIESIRKIVKSQDASLPKSYFYGSKELSNYKIDKTPEGYEYIHCLNCDRKSFHPKDIEHKFCAHCGIFFIERTQQ